MAASKPAGGRTPGVAEGDAKGIAGGGAVENGAPLGRRDGLWLKAPGACCCCCSPPREGEKGMAPAVEKEPAGKVPDAAVGGTGNDGIAMGAKCAGGRGPGLAPFAARGGAGRFAVPVAAPGAALPT